MSVENEGEASREKPTWIVEPATPVPEHAAPTRGVGRGQEQQRNPAEQAQARRETIRRLKTIFPRSPREHAGDERLGARGKIKETIVWLRNEPQPLKPHEQAQQDRQHEVLVEAIRARIQQQYEALGPRARYFTPAGIIRDGLIAEEQYGTNDHAEDRRRAAEIRHLRKAWDVIAYKWYRHDTDEPVTWAMHLAGLELSDHAKRTGQTTLTLSERQRRVLEAFAEAIDIPHRKGQTTVEIPEKLRLYADWLEDTGQGSMESSTRISFEEWRQKSRRKS